MLEAEAEERMLVEETVDVTLPWDRAPQGARHPLTTLQEAQDRLQKKYDRFMEMQAARSK